ncbi:MAG: sigma-70 family RNA polymerase sigma factor [Pirellulaceae bacterium]|jgi:RNA polymerase sigma-70 factor (ECF subfamily)|nr:sigma-70 family RNA polymerase sigma factor [Pirellulaceae bacterium]MDP7017506.1 sigma-70 family RNA polymerase sigma factor [Pirellulaceae bacterium]
MASDQQHESNGDNALGSTSRTLLDRARGDDGDAWDQLTTFYAPLVAFWVRQIGIDESDLPDVVQDVFQSVSTNLRRFRKDQPGQSFRAWLRTIARNKAFDLLRRRKREPRGTGGTEAWRRLHDHADELEPDELDQPEDEPECERQLILQSALQVVRKRTEDRTWQAFWRVVVDGRSAAEAAEELQMTQGAVRVAKSRVLQRLRAALDELPE